MKRNSPFDLACGHQKPAAAGAVQTVMSSSEENMSANASSTVQAIEWSQGVDNARSAIASFIPPS